MIPPFSAHKSISSQTASTADAEQLKENGLFFIISAALRKKCPIYRALTGHPFSQCPSGFDPNLCPVGVRISGHFCV